MSNDLASSSSASAALAPPATSSAAQLSTSATSTTSSSGSSTTSSQSENTKERKHFKKVLHAFDAYLPYSLAANNARRRSFYALPRSHRLLLSSLGSPLPAPILPKDEQDGDVKDARGAATESAFARPVTGGRGFKSRLDEIDDRIRRNADVLSAIVNDTRSFLDEGSGSDGGAIGMSRDAEVPHQSQAQNQDEIPDQSAKHSSKTKGRIPVPGPPPHTSRRGDHDVDKVRSTIKQLVRDWSIEGAHERETAYAPIIGALHGAFAGVEHSKRSSIRVLVPGAGLGRLAFEIAWQGYSCQGNEYSFYMLLASHFVLNKTSRANEHVVYPFIHSSSNWRTAADLLRAVSVPDVKPSELPSHVDFSMVAGEFIEVYLKPQERGAWHAVATCYFIDTAHNFARYLEVINHVLPVGGVWINVGPLLWHYEGTAHGTSSSTASGSASESGLSIELTLDEVIGLIELMGFAIESQRTLVPQTYTGHPNSMLQYEYTPEFWVARKIAHISPAPVV